MLSITLSGGAFSRAFFSLIFLSTLSGLLRWLKQRRRSYPPGPAPKPLVGNLFDLPRKMHAHAYVKWAKQYKSDILFASALGTSVLILNKREDAEELLDRRSKIYSDRPWVPMMPLTGFDVFTVLLPYGDLWRVHKKNYQEFLRAAVLPKYYSLQKRSVERVLREIVQKPEKVIEHVKLLNISVLMNLMYGYTPESFEDRAVMAAEESLALGANLYLPGTTIANVFPILTRLPSWFPGAAFKRQAERVRELASECQRIPWEFVQKQYASGNYQPSRLSHYIEESQAGGIKQEELQIQLDIAFTTYAGGSETTAVTLTTFVYAMAAYPEVQRKAQALLDAVLGNDRLPNFSDRPNLPYIDAIVYELLRWRPPAPMGLPHALTQDDYYNGYFIPKGTIVMSNVHAMSKDPSVYTDPETFNPDRFMNPDGTLRREDFPVYVFGFGRRRCPGNDFARDVLWNTIANLLSVLQFSPKKDENGVEIEIDPGIVDTGLIYSKSPFVCDVRPRSEEARYLIESTGNA